MSGRLGTIFNHKANAHTLEVLETFSSSKTASSLQNKKTGVWSFQGPATVDAREGGSGGNRGIKIIVFKRFTKRRF